MDGKNVTHQSGEAQSGSESDLADLFTPDEIAISCRVAVTTVYGWLSSGKLKGQKLGGGVWRVTRRALAEFKGEVGLFGGDHGHTPDN